MNNQDNGLGMAERKLTFADLQRMLDKFDWEAHNRRVVWGLNEPMCCCNSCYDRWFEWGKELYKDNIQAYEERKKEALLHLRNKQESRRIDEEKRLQERKQGYLCSVA